MSGSFWRKTVVGTLIGMCVAGPALALELETTGWWRNRYFYIDNVPFDGSGGTQKTEYFDMRMTLYPTLHVTDSIRIKSRLDILDNVIWGQNENEPSILAGLADATSQFDRNLDPVDDFQVEHLYAEILTDVGLVRVGRMPSHWGLGILANSGGQQEWGAEGNGPETGDSVDRLLFLTDLAVPFGWDGEHWISALLFDRSIELSIFDEGDDVNQFVIANLYSNGSMSPRVKGTVEFGNYNVFITQDDDDTNALLVDAYFHLELPLGNVTTLFLEGEGVLGFGETNRGGLVGKGRRDDFIESITDGLAGTLPRSIAETIAAEGTTVPFVANLVADGLVDEGLSPEVAATIATQGASAGFDVARDEDIDIDVAGGVVRGGLIQGPLKLWGEWGYSSGGDDDTILRFAGPVNSNQPEARAALEAQVDDALGAALTGTRLATLPFDSEFDVALILYKEVGPLNPVTLTPLVQNTWYLKGVVEYGITDRTTVYALGLFGELNKGVETFSIEGADDGDELTPVTVVSQGEEDALGFEIDWGIDHIFSENLRGEVKMGYLFTGAAFGPEAQNVFMIRPQISVMF